MNVFGVRVIFLNRFFHPDHSATSQMLSDLAFELAKTGQAVSVITSRQRYDAPEVRLAARETLGGVEIHRVWTSRFGRSNLIGRAIDYGTFYLSAAWRLWRLARAGDVVVAKTDPPMLSVIVAPICRLRGAKLANWLQDIFPEVAEALGVGRSSLANFGYSLLRRLRDRSLKRAVVTVAIGEQMAKRLSGLGLPPERIRVIQNWADGALIRPIDPAANALRRDWGLSQAFVVGYSGNLGRAHAYRTLLDAISLIEAERRSDRSGHAEGRHGCPPIVWLFIGGGAQYEGFKRAVADRGLSSVQFQPYQARERLAESLSAADVHLVSLRPELEGLIVPSKFYGVAAAGRPAIFIGDVEGEIADVVSRHRCGVPVAEGDGVALARAILDLANDPLQGREMGVRARAAFERHYDKPVAVARWTALLREISERQPGGARISNTAATCDAPVSSPSAD